MIEIIKQGKKRKEDAPHKVECFRCGCIFTHTKEDCQYSHGAAAYYIHCPNCGSYIELGFLYL